MDSDGKPSRLWPRFSWDEAGPDDFDARRRLVLIQEKPACAVDWTTRTAADGAPDDDTSGEILTVLVDGRGKTRRWAAIWLVPPDARSSSDFRIAAQPRTGGGAPGAWVYSEPFRVSSLPQRSRASGPVASGGASA